jgi:hypothetical protein
LILQLVIGFEPMRSHRSVARLDARRQVDRDAGRLPALLTAAVERQTHSVGVRHAAVERLADRGLEFGGAIAVEEPQQGGGDGPIVAALGSTTRQSLARRSCAGEPVGAAMTAGGTFLRDQGLDVRALLDLIAPVITAGMAGEDLGAVDNTYLARIGQHGKHASHLGMRYRVVIEIESDIRRFADLDGDALDQRIGVVRGNSAGSALRARAEWSSCSPQCLGHGSTAGGGAGSRCGRSAGSESRTSGNAQAG